MPMVSHWALGLSVFDWPGLCIFGNGVLWRQGRRREMHPH